MRKRAIKEIILKKYKLKFYYMNEEIEASLFLALKISWK